MESFRLYWPGTDPEPVRVVSDYKPKQLDEFRERFAPIARQYRWQRRLAIVSVLGFFGCIVGTIAMKLSWGWIPVLAFWFIGVSSIGTMPPLECPACSGGLRRLKRYCPDCGNMKLEKEISSTSAHCNVCSRGLWIGKG